MISVRYRFFLCYDRLFFRGSITYTDESAFLSLKYCLSNMSNVTEVINSVPPFLVRPYQSISLTVCADRIMTCALYELNATISAGVHILVFNVESYEIKNANTVPSQHISCLIYSKYIIHMAKLSAIQARHIVSTINATRISWNK